MAGRKSERAKAKKPIPKVKRAVVDPVVKYKKDTRTSHFLGSISGCGDDPVDYNHPVATEIKYAPTTLEVTKSIFESITAHENCVNVKRDLQQVDGGARGEERGRSLAMIDTPAHVTEIETSVVHHVEAVEIRSDLPANSVLLHWPPVKLRGAALAKHLQALVEHKDKIIGEKEEEIKKKDERIAELTTLQPPRE